MVHVNANKQAPARRRSPPPSVARPKAGEDRTGHGGSVERSPVPGAPLLHRGGSPTWSPAPAPGRASLVSFLVAHGLLTKKGRPPRWARGSLVEGNWSVKRRSFRSALLREAPTGGNSVTHPDMWPASPRSYRGRRKVLDQVVENLAAIRRVRGADCQPEIENVLRVGS